MTGILSREQEFHKLNAQLDNMAKYATEKPQPTKIDPKFATYTKKGPITVIRKVEDISLTGLKEKIVHTLPKDNLSLNGARKKVLAKERPLQRVAEEKKNHSERHDVTSPEHSVRTLPSTKSSLLKSPPNAFVRYKNSSFVASPSLEVLAKEENESIRSQATSRLSDVSGSLSTSRPKANLSSDGLIKYLKSRITILQDEHEALTHEMANQKELVEKSIDRQKKIESQRDAAYTRNNTLSEQISKIEDQLDDALRRLKESNAENNLTRKELEAVKREMKVLTQTNANLEKRLYRTNEELENTRNTLNQMKNNERETKESVRNESDSRDRRIRALNKQRSDLLNAYKKQLFLIDNLKRQNLCMEQSRMIAFGEREFTKVLDWQSTV